VKQSISRILNIRIALILIATNLLIGLAFYSFFVQLAEKEFQRHSKIQAKHIGDTFSQQLWLFDLGAVEQLGKLLFSGPGVTGLRLLDHEKNIIIEKGIFTQDKNNHLHNETLYHQEILVGYLDIIFTDTAWENHKKESLFISSSMVVATVLLTILMVAFLLNRHIKKPLKDLQRDISNLADGQFRESNLASNSIEVQSILDEFNKLASSLTQREVQRDNAELKRKQSEHTLREAEERFRLIFETSPDPAIIVRTDNNMILDVNNTFVSTTQRKKHQVIDCSLENVDLWTNRKSALIFQKKLQKEKAINNFAIDFKLDDGKTKNGKLSGRLFKLRDSVCAILVLRDVTVENAAKNAFVELDQEKNEFISMAAHELRTPLSTIIGFTEFLLTPEKFGGFSEEQKKDFLNEIYDRGEALDRIIDDLLDVSRIERGHSLTLDLQKTDFKSLLTKTFDFYRDNNSNHSFRLDLQKEPELTMMRIDRHRIKQVLENLFNNALKYSPNGGDIIVTAVSDSNGWKISVKDRGIGMTPAQTDRIFDKFYRVDASNTAIQGLGLGMSIVKQIIDAHEGEIEVESDLGKGTIVTFTLPCKTD